MNTFLLWNFWNQPILHEWIVSIYGFPHLSSSFYRNRFNTEELEFLSYLNSAFKNHSRHLSFFPKDNNKHALKPAYIKYCSLHQKIQCIMKNPIQTYVVSWRAFFDAYRGVQFDKFYYMYMHILTTLGNRGRTSPCTSSASETRIVSTDPLSSPKHQPQRLIVDRQLAIWKCCSHNASP